MLFPEPLIDGFKWAKEGLRKSSCPWVTAGAIAAFHRGYDLAADFPTWADAKRFLILAAENKFDPDALATEKEIGLDPFVVHPKRARIIRAVFSTSVR